MPGTPSFSRFRFPTQPFGSTYFWFTAAFSFLVDVQAATRLYLSIALVGTILAFASWLKTVEPGREVQALPASMLVYGFFFQVGFLPYLFAMPFFFLALKAGALIGSGEHQNASGWWSGFRFCFWSFTSRTSSHSVCLFFCFSPRPGSRGHKRMELLALAMVPAFLHLGWFLLTETPITPIVDLRVELHALAFPFHLPGTSFQSPFDPPSGEWKYQAETVAAWVLVGSAFLAAAWRGGRTSRRLGLLSLLLLAVWLVTPTNLASSSGTLWISLACHLPAGISPGGRCPDGLEPEYPPAGSDHPRLSADGRWGDLANGRVSGGRTRSADGHRLDP